MARVATLNLQRRQALQTLKTLGLASIGSLSIITYKDSKELLQDIQDIVWQSNANTQSSMQSNTKAQSKPNFNFFPITLLYSSDILSDFNYFITLLHANLPFILLFDSNFSHENLELFSLDFTALNVETNFKALHSNLFITRLQNFKENLQEKSTLSNNALQSFVESKLHSQLESIIQSLQHNELYYFHNPSNTDLAQQQLLNVLRNNIFTNISLQFSFGKQSDSIFKEAYCKILCYLDLATDEHLAYLSTRIPNVTKEKIKELFNSQTLMDSKNLITTKVKIDSNNSNNTSFATSKPMRYSRDFIIQLKRIAEYSYQSYKGACRVDDDFNNSKKDSKNAPFLSCFVYNSGFIPTTIDIMD